MSHQAYAWVLSDGPKLKTIGRDGNPYRTRARAMRAVLSSIANAANAHGENAHPGLGTVVEESLYTKSHVLRIIDDLVAEGWLQITEEGRGRGHSTVYRICMDRGKVPLWDLSEKGNGPIHEPERSHLRRVKVSSDDSAPLFSTDTTKTTTEDPASSTPEKVTEADPIKRHAHRLTVLAFEQPTKPVTRGGFPAVMSRIEAVLRAGHTTNAIEAVICSGEPVTWTADGLSTALGKQRGGKQPENIFRKMASEGR